MTAVRGIRPAGSLIPGLLRQELGSLDGAGRMAINTFDHPFILVQLPGFALTTVAEGTRFENHNCLPSPIWH